MNEIDRSIEIIEKEFTNRTIEINYMYTRMFNYIEMYKSSDNSCMITTTDIYFMARSVIVFTYATLEKYVKKVTELVLGVIIKYNYFNNNYVKELMEILKCNKDSKRLFELLMHNKNIYVYDGEFKIASDKGYFSRNSRVDSETIAYIIKVFNLNQVEPFINLPKITIDSISKKRMELAHGDYIEELSKFGPTRNNLEIKKIQGYIEDDLKINERSKKDLISFFTQFKDKNIQKLEEINSYINL